jgi:Rab GDP dissociation inhibitor
MEQEYDVIVLGTGLKECILSGLMSVGKKKVLHMDRNSYYGGESASLNLEQLYKRFRGDDKPKKDLGRTRDYCVDLCPKFLMACGNLVKVLLHTRVTRYLEFKSVAGSYVYKGGAVFKVPATAKEGWDSSLMGFFQKTRYASFVKYVYGYDEKDPKTHDGLDLNKMTCKKLIEHFKLDENTQAFTGHAIALYLDDDYLNKPAKDFVERIKLYGFSVQRYGNSPYIYPIWGLGGLPEGFSRLCAIHGGTYMLNKPISKIIYDESGKVTGVESEGKVAYCKQLIADPSYFAGTDKIKKTGQIARCIAITSTPIKGTNSDSAQIIIPAKAIKERKSDVYASMISYHHRIAAEGKFIVVMSAVVEGKEVKEDDQKGVEATCKRELAAAIGLLEKVDELFFWVTDSFEAVNDSKKDGCFISNTYDATTHFESTTTEVLELYEKITGSKIDLTIATDPDKLADPDSLDPAGEGETESTETTEETGKEKTEG